VQVVVGLDQATVQRLEDERGRGGHAIVEHLDAGRERGTARLAENQSLQSRPFATAIRYPALVSLMTTA
jgi:hypothetical protein